MAESMTNEFKKTVFLEEGEHKLFSYLDIQDDYDSYEFNFHLKENSNLRIIFSVFSQVNKKVLINIYHEENNAFSQCICNGVSKKGSISFTVNGFISKNTMGNDCKQEINGLVLNEESKISGNPNLIIDSNKIKANHKLAIGTFNPDYLFYLKTKGISETNSKLLLANKFYQEHIGLITDESKKVKALDMIKEYFDYEF